jgi:hypothetical protein
MGRHEMPSGGTRAEVGGCSNHKVSPYLKLEVIRPLDGALTTTSKWGPSCCLVLKLVFITKQQGAPCTHFLGASNSESNLTIVGLKKKKHNQQIGFFLLSFSFILSHLIGELGKQKLQKFLETLF